MKNRLLYTYKKMLLSRDGLAAVEFALFLPLFIILTFGAIEVTRYVLITQKMERVSISLSDLVAQSKNVNSGDLSQIILAASQLMLPYDFDTNGYAIISSVTKTGEDPPVINWQYTSGGTVQTSLVGTSGGNATMPGGFAITDKETVIIAEVFFSYEPILSGTIYNSSTMYRYSIHKPRLGDLKVLGYNIYSPKNLWGEIWREIYA
ncbi:MAG: TadE/TadG family type IV pilus assembly protein [Rickettsiales bacterium]